VRDCGDAPTGTVSGNASGGAGVTLVGDGVPDMLQRVAERLLETAKSDRESYATALALLAADALMTYACQAVAESHPERLSDLR